jgi:hypothetical protein
MAKIKIDNIQKSSNELHELAGKDLSNIKGGLIRFRVTIPLNQEDDYYDDDFDDFAFLFKFFDD